MPSYEPNPNKTRRYNNIWDGTSPRADGINTTKDATSSFLIGVACLITPISEKEQKKTKMRYW